MASPDAISAEESGAPSRWALPAILLGSVCLTFGPVFVRVSDTGPTAAAFWRLALAAPLLFLLSKVARDPVQRLAPSLLGVLICASLFFAADLAAWHLGLLVTKMANANLLGNATSFLLPIWAFFTTRQWPSRWQALALALAAVGTVCLLGRSFELSRQNLIGDLLCLLAGVLYTGFIITIGRARNSLSALSTLTLTTAIGAAPLLIAAIALGEQIMPQQWWSIIGLAFFSQVLGQGLMIYAVNKVSPLLFGICLLTQPILAALIGWLWYDEKFAALDWVGAILIGLAIIVVHQPAQRQPRPSAAL
jgi:drug/metabolite transporter (DMT)-like permease